MTNNWSAGYVSEINYTYGFYRELTPAILSLCALTRGQSAPDVTAPLNYCELGCGQGVSTNILAAANPNIQFVATDFNPSQIIGAQTLARDAGTTNVRFLDSSFAEMVGRSDLPDFDIVALHGIYSWISPENRYNIVEFIRKRLKPGGLVYISYNTLPGWASAMPLRRLFVDTAAERGGPILDKIDQALVFAQSLADSKARYFAANPGILDRLGKIKDQPRSYLAHEYFNRDWTPFYFNDVVDELSAAKLSWVASAQLLDAVDALNLTHDQQKFLASIGGVERREGVRDFLVNQQFRRDLFAKGTLPLSQADVRDRWMNMRLVLSAPRASLPMKVTGGLGEINLQQEVYAPLADVLAEGPIEFKQLLSDPRTQALGFQRLQQAVTILSGAALVQPCLDAAGLESRKVATDRFNTVVINRARSSAELNFLASPVTGGGVSVDRLVQLFLLARKSGDSDPVAFVWRILSDLGQRLIKNGVTLHSAEENLADLAERHAVFEKEHLPSYQLLGLV
ncbi:class I SAM-dependent methyltransferase [Niveispirillum cyanobacteriorum]|uniref:Uncharacterized protein n=1 Tax=Niveispirillum cyanobacteriorum TaxID=1612173 RepID=A0A2K9NJ18_9PROT|nr:class I SAM-dependent methyltransferase [Niveispirillum cyanobacteriorum]AUN33079.1 hypothetical protein C0V82_21975 [Niveispirillum cyanobacteriorum]GGE45552.1 hypothetical protein GCM10011317_00060 [Niveispirillum cyanobacteriorum]